MVRGCGPSAGEDLKDVYRHLVEQSAHSNSFELANGDRIWFLPADLGPDDVEGEPESSDLLRDRLHPRDCAQPKPPSRGISTRSEIPSPRC